MNSSHNNIAMLSLGVICTSRALGFICIIALAAILIMLWLSDRARSNFVSQRAVEVFDKSKNLFERTRGKATYTEFKKNVNDADAVLYTDVRQLWNKDALTPREIQKVL